MAHRTVQVPVRGCDVGGWTDTWFAGAGRVCSLALEPGVTVRAAHCDGATTFQLPDVGERFAIDAAPDRHHLLVEAVREAGVPDGAHVALSVTAAVPPATSLGTSASVCVGVIAAVDALVHGTIRPPAELAAAAHRVEADRLLRQSGVQDQLAAAHGGANRMEIDYPSASVTALELDPAVRSAVDHRLLHIAYGGAHDSSAVHETVIAELEGEGPTSPRLERLRGLADDAASALTAGDVAAWGAVLTETTEAQRALHAALVSADADALIVAARAIGALGWKVNGAGGAGGSLSILCPTSRARDRLAAEARRLGQLPLPLRLASEGAHAAAG